MTPLLAFLPAAFALALAAIVWRGRSIVRLQTLVLTVALALLTVGWGWLTVTGAPQWIRWTLVLAPAPVLIAQHIHLRRTEAELRRVRASADAAGRAALAALDRAVQAAPPPRGVGSAASEDSTTS